MFGWKGTPRRTPSWTRMKTPSPRQLCMPTTESATSREELESLIRDAKDELALSPERFANIFMHDIRELEEFASVPAHTAEREPLAPQLQVYMRRSLRVVEALLKLGFTP